MTKNGSGVDSEARAALWSLLFTLRLAYVQDRRAYQLVRRDIGRPCRNWHHENMEGHCDRIPLGEMPLLAGMTWEQAKEETQRAVVWLMELYVEPAGFVGRQ